MDTSTLVAVATSTEAALTVQWNAMGTPVEERTAILERTSAAVSLVYASVVAEQTKRTIDLKAEVITLAATISGMRVSMEEPGLIVRERERKRVQACPLNTSRARQCSSELNVA